MFRLIILLSLFPLFLLAQRSEGRAPQKNVTSLPDGNFGAVQGSDLTAGENKETTTKTAVTLPIEGGRVVFTEVVKIDSTIKTVTYYSAVKQFLVKNGYRITYDDGKKLIAAGQHPYKTYNEKSPNIQTDFTVEVEFKKSRYKATISNFEYSLYSSLNIPSQKERLEYIIESEYQAYVAHVNFEASMLLAYFQSEVNTIQEGKSDW